MRLMRWCRWRRVPLLGLLVLLAGCAIGQTPATASATRTPAPCGARYGGADRATLPDATFAQTTVYARVPLPPHTRAYDDDAAGLRGRFLCSAGTTRAVQDFMTAHLGTLGWQPVTSVAACGRAVIPRYGDPWCWQQGPYYLFVGINSQADWVVAFVDPAFLS